MSEELPTGTADMGKTPFCSPFFAKVHLSASEHVFVLSRLRLLLGERVGPHLIECLGKDRIFFFRDLRLCWGGILLEAKRVWAGKMCRILIVDDHEPIRRRIQTLLGARKGWFVCGEAADGIQAVEEARSLRPDLIIMDVSMPKMNGLDATRIIVREVRESRVLIISQNDPAVVRRQALEARAHGFIDKSKIQHDLIAAVESILMGDGQSEDDTAS